MFKKLYNHKLAKIVTSLIYTYCFYYGYRDFLYGAWLYAGYDILPGREENISFTIYSFILAIIPSVFYKGIKNISSFISTFIYFVLYVPTIITFFYLKEGEIIYIMWLQFLFALSMTMLMLADRVKVTKKYMLPSRINILKLLLYFTWILTLYVAFIFRNTLNFVGYEDVYIQRTLSSAVGNDVFTGYLTAWLANVLIPFTAAYGLFSKKYIYYISSFIAAVVIYMTTADKAILLFPIMILLLYVFLRKRNLKNAFSSIGSLLILIMTGTFVYGFSLFVVIFWMRTIGNGGYLNVYYHNFFETNPNTYYSHINVINSFTNMYPFGDKSIGQVVGSEYWSYDQNANANFWATDGIAAIGDLGILLSGFILFWILVLFNKIGKSYNKLFLICIFVPFTSSLLNQSLFSSLFTGGGFLIMLILSFKPIIQNPYINENINHNRS